MVADLALEPAIAAKPIGGGAVRATSLAGAAGTALLALWIASSGDYTPLLPVAMLALLLGLIWAVFYTSRHTDWLVFAVGFIYLLIPTSLLSEGTRGFVHYGFLLLFALPVLPRLLRSGLLRQGTFRLYCVYFAWAGATSLYSLAPTFSLGRLLGSLLGFSVVAVCVLGITTAAEAHRLLFRFFLACSILVGVTVISAIALPHALTWQTPLDGFDPSYVNRLRAAGITIAGIDRFRGIFGNANDVGALMLATISSALACWKLSTKAQKYVLASVVVAVAAASLRADSRSALGASIVGCALYILWQYRLRGALIISLASFFAFAAGSLLHGFGDYATRGLDTLTGRTDIWAYAFQRIRERPLTGYGYEVSGEIFASRYFPLWHGPWDMGPHSSLHDGYLAHLVGIGVPATAFWLFIILRPWIFIFRQTADPWNLKAVALLAIVPALVYNLTEAALADFFGLIGFFFGLAWALAERYRLQTIGQQQAAATEALQSLPPAIRVFQ